jgi:hypothetical protein
LSGLCRVEPDGKWKWHQVWINQQVEMESSFMRENTSRFIKKKLALVIYNKPIANRTVIFHRTET